MAAASNANPVNSVQGLANKAPDYAETMPGSQQNDSKSTLSSATDGDVRDAAVALDIQDRGKFKDLRTRFANCDIPTPFPSLLRDDIYNNLSSHFLMTGKGRRPNLPNPLPLLTNRLLCQFHMLKEDANASWKDVHVWFCKVLPAEVVTASQLQHKCQNVWEAAQRIPVNMNASLSFNTISTELSEIGLSHDILLSCSDYSPPPNFIISNAFVLSLEKFRTKESLPLSFINKWIQLFLPSSVSKSKVMHRYNLLLKKLKTLKKDQFAFDAFMGQPFFCITNTNNNSSVAVPTKDPVFILKNQKKVEKKLAAALEDKETLELRNNVLKDTILELNVDKCNNNTSTVLKKSKSIQANTLDIDRLIKESYENQEALKIQESENHSLKVNINKLDLKIQDQNAVIADLKKQIKSEQTLKSNYKQKLMETIMTSEAILCDDFNDDICSTPNLKCPGNVNNAYSNDVYLTYMALQGEADVAASKCSKVVNIVSKYFYKKEIPLNDLPNVQSALNMSNAGQFLSKTQVVESILDADHFTLATDETSRQKRRYLERHIVLSNGGTMSLGFSEIASESADTLLEKSIELFRDLCDIYCTDNEEMLRDTLFKEMLIKMKCLMSDRAAVMKLFDKKMSCYKSEVLGTDCSTHVLFCNAHFLLGLASAAEAALKEIESKLGELGRDGNSKFSRFANSTETATLRVIRAAAEVFGPRGDEKSGCRAEWLAFMGEEKEKSKFTSFRSNRFNNIFDNASALVYHEKHIIKFLKNHASNDNLKLQSIMEDICDNNVLTLVSALGRMNYLVTSPYWMLMNSSKRYSDFPAYVQLLATFFEKKDFDVELPVFPEFVNNDVSPCNIASDNIELFEDAFKTLCTKFYDILKRQLCDFIGEGVFAGALDSDVEHILSTCPLSNLTGERLFGDLDYDMSKRRRASLLLRSSINMWKHNKTGSWFYKKKKTDAIRLLLLARKEGKNIRQRSRDEEKRVRNEIIERLKENERKMHEKEIGDREKHLKVVNAVISQGGVCITKEDVDVLMKERNKVENLKAQIRYRKLVLGDKDLTLNGNLNKLYETLVSSLGSGEAEPPRKRQITS